MDKVELFSKVIGVVVAKDTETAHAAAKLVKASPRNRLCLSWTDYLLWALWILSFVHLGSNGEVFCCSSGRWLAVDTVGQRLIEGSISFRCFNISWILWSFFYIRFCVQGFFGNIGNRNQVKWFYVPWVQPPITMLGHISLDLFIEKLLIFLSVMSRLKIMQVFFLWLQWNLSSIVLFEFFPPQRAIYTVSHSEWRMILSKFWNTL